jgi:hypothetical protein
MGIEELILHRAEQKGKAEVVRNLITKMGLSDAQAADIAEVDLSFVREVRAAIELDGKKQD